MTSLLEMAFDRAQSLPPESQDEIARLLLAYAGEMEGPAELSVEDEAAVLRSREAARRGEFATDDKMRALWAKYGL